MMKRRLSYPVRYNFDPRFNGYYDPSPDPFPWGLLIGVIGILLWTNPNMINALLEAIWPAFKEAQEEQRKQMLEMVMYILLITVVVCGIALLIWYMERRKKHFR